MDKKKLQGASLLAWARRRKGYSQQMVAEAVINSLQGTKEGLERSIPNETEEQIHWDHSDARE